MVAIAENLADVPYKDRQFPEGAGKGFYVQMAFILSRGAAIEEQACDPAEIYVCDSSLLVEHAYARMHLKSDVEALDLAVRQIEYLRRKLGPPDLLVYLDCSPQTQFDRIQKRMQQEPDRAFEKRLTVEYLHEMSFYTGMLVDDYEQRGGAVLRLNSEIVDFSHLPYLNDVYETLLDRLEQGSGAFDRAAYLVRKGLPAPEGVALQAAG